VLFVRKNFFHPNLRGGSPEKFFSFSFFRQHFWGKYEKIGTHCVHVGSRKLDKK
jgi:hypothetical protein